MTAEQFREFAGAKGLRGIGGEETVDGLRQEYGAARWFDFLDVIYLPPARLFDGLTQPWYIRDDATCFVPPVTFDCDFDGGHGAEQNHLAALAGLSREFGQPEAQEIHNVWNHRWKFGRTELSILTFKRDRTPGNSLYQRFPQLWDFCRVTIENPWLRKIAEDTAKRLRAMGEGDLLRMPGEWAAQGSSMPLWERGLLRAADLPAHGQMVFWRSLADGRFGWYGDGIAAEFDRVWQPELVMIEVEGERGPPDYSNVMLKIANPFSRAGERVAVRLLQRERLGSLRPAAEKLGRFWELKVSESRYE